MMINITSEEYALIDKALRKQKDFDEVEMSRYPEDSDIFQREIEIYTNLAKRLSERKWLKPGYYVPDADRNLIPIDEWLKRPDKFSAETIVYTTLTMQALGMGAIEISKKPLPCGRVNWEEAQKAAAVFRDGFRCPTRHEAIDMYDNRFIGLDAALEAIGGERLEEGVWTKDEDADPRYQLGERVVRALRVRQRAQLQQVQRLQGAGSDSIISLILTAAGFQPAA